MLKKEVTMGKEPRTRESPRCRIALFLVYFGAYMRTPVANKNKRLETQKGQNQIGKSFIWKQRLEKKKKKNLKPQKMEIPCSWDTG